MASIRLNLVVAACNNNGIGINGELPWRLKKDMAFFKKITSETKLSGNQNAVIMGRKTWFSIPEKFRPLKGRLNIVLSRELKEVPEGVHIARSLPDAVRLVTSGELETKIENVHIIGGSSVYQEAMTGPYDCRVYLTRILKDFHCDTFLPAIDGESFQKVTNPEDVPDEIQTENDITFKFEVYDKVPMAQATACERLSSRFDTPSTKNDILSEDVVTHLTNTHVASNHVTLDNMAADHVTLNIMAAMCHVNRGIGKGSGLPWPSLRQDYQRYLKMTCTPQLSDHSTEPRKIIHINGRITFLSVGAEEMSLPNVYYIVISKTLKESNFTHPKVFRIVESFQEAVDRCDQLWSGGQLDSVWVMGGQSVFESALKHDRCRRLYLTHVYKDFESDAFFPRFENNFIEIRMDNWKTIMAEGPTAFFKETGTSSEVLTDNGVQYAFKVPMAQATACERLSSRFDTPSTKNDILSEDVNTHLTNTHVASNHVTLDNMAADHVTLNIMAAMCHVNRGIGRGSGLPWPSLRQDYQRYLKMTCTPQLSDHSTEPRKIIHINGRITFLSVGAEEMSLPNVYYIVISKTLKESNFTHPKVFRIVESFQEAVDRCDQLWSGGQLDSVWVMGGQSVFESALKHDRCRRLYLTHVYKDFESDAFFPRFENNFIEIRETGTSSEVLTDNGVQYAFKVYCRNKT